MRKYHRRNVATRGIVEMRVITIIIIYHLTKENYLAILPSMKKLQGKLKENYERRASVIKAMAHPTRLFILDLLEDGALCVCDINDLIEADLSTVSKHLLLLKKAGLVSSEKRGLQVYYSLEMPCVLKAFACIENKR